jgi:hypothetical protein
VLLQIAVGLIKGERVRRRKAKEKKKKQKKEKSKKILLSLQN